MLFGAHVTCLKEEIERDAVAQQSLRSFAQMSVDLLPRTPRSSGEEKLRWLGIIGERETGWEWTAPVMRKFAEYWR